MREGRAGGGEALRSLETGLKLECNPAVPLLRHLLEQPLLGFAGEYPICLDRSL